MPSPLWRNRDFVLLQTGQLLSTAGAQSTAIAYPLLVLATTQSAAKAGLVTFAGIAPRALFGLPGGAAADRFDRRTIMILADVVRALTLGGLVGAIALDELAFWQIAVVAFVEGSCSAFFDPAGAGALRSVVSRAQLPAAAGAQQARVAAVSVAGPPLGGALYSLGRALPFLVDAVSYAFSIVSLLLMRTPFQQTREPEAVPWRAQLREGLRFLWNQPFLRTTTFLYGLTNFIGPGLLLVLVVVGTRAGLSGGEVGLLLSAFAACTLVGALASPLARRFLSVRTILLLELWTWLGCGLFVAWPNVYVLIASILPSALAIPVTDSVVIGYRLAITPDRLVGRVEGVRRSIALLIAPLGPLVAGLLLSETDAQVTVAVFAAFGLVLAVWGTLSPAIRAAPSLQST
jgi:MFS family permease